MPIFEDECKNKWEKGAKENINDNWDKWNKIKFIEEAQDELIDCYNYMKKLVQKYNSKGCFPAFIVQSKCRNLFFVLERWKNEIQDSKERQKMLY